MTYFYIAIQVKQDRNETVFTKRTNETVNIGYYAYTLKVSTTDNLVSRLDSIGGLMAANIMPTKKAARETVNYWNDCFKKNGTYLFSNPAF